MDFILTACAPLGKGGCDFPQSTGWSAGICGSQSYVICEARDRRVRSAVWTVEGTGERESMELLGGCGRCAVSEVARCPLGACPLSPAASWLYTVGVWGSLQQYPYLIDRVVCAISGDGTTCTSSSRQSTRGVSPFTVVIMYTQSLSIHD